MKKRVISVLVFILLLTFLSAEALAATVYISGNCHLRSAPSKDSKSLGVVNSDDYLEYMYENSEDYRGVMWFKVRYGSKIGWVSSVYADVEEDDGPLEDRWVQVYSDSNVRVSPNIDAPKLGVVGRGMSLDYLGHSIIDERGVMWYMVQFNGYEAWISSKYTVLFP